MLEQMISRPVPVTEVVANSTPVVAFGDPRIATAATLGINPSWREFLSKDGALLRGQARRLPTIASLNATDTASLRPDQIAEAIAECASYFDCGRNPYRLWFDPLDEILQAAIGVSFYSRTACHLDLVQWATLPQWSKLSKQTQITLLAEGLPHLQALLRNGAARTVLLNGQQVIKHVVASGLVTFQHVGSVPLDSGKLCALYMGVAEAITFIGWSANLQSSWGISRSFRARLAAALKELAVNIPDAGKLQPSNSGESLPAAAGKLNRQNSNSIKKCLVSIETAKRGQRMIGRQILDDDGYVARGTTVESKNELLEFLRDWLAGSDRPTIGPIANFGGKPWIVLNLGENRTAVLNADTKREAVIAYVTQTESTGADTPWRVVANQNGRWNKLVFETDGDATTGWYCYLRPDEDGPGQV